MSIKIGSNIASLNAQRRLGEATSSLSSVYEKLSSGQRINRASDDAAGLAIADDLKAKGRIYTQAIRNGNDGISLLNIADSAIDALSGVVTRIRELSEQSANGTYSNKQREALDNEAQQLSKEFTRITQTTSFNGLKVFDGSLGTGVRLQLGNGITESINASVGGAIGTGQFNNANSFSTDTGSSYGYSSEVSLGDLNGDGILDMVTAGYASDGGISQGQASVLLGNGDGTFQNAVKFSTDTGSTSGRSRAVSLGDLNGDGILDMVTAGYANNGGSYQGQVSVLLGNGDGTFQNALKFSADTGSSYGYSRAVSLGDINGDAILDMVTAGYSSDGGSSQGQASVLLGNGDGTFQNAVKFSTDTGSARGRSRAVSLGDLNGDGILDMVTAGYADNGGSYQGQVSVLLGNGDGTFQNALNFSADTGSSSGFSFAVSLGDINGDGILDMVTAGFANDGISYQGQVSVLLGNSDGTFQNAVKFSADTGSSNGYSYAVSLGDLNGDGTLDMVTAGVAGNGGSYQGQASVLLGNGNGTFQNAVKFSADTGSSNGGSYAVNLGDLNGDGILDMVTAGSANSQGQASVLLAKTQDGLGAMLEFSLKTKSDALQSMGMLDRTLENLAKQRGTIGASQSRVNIAISNLQSSRENFAAAESRIRDADIAAEAANLVRTQILQQAAASVLSQANQQPNLAIQLLR